MQRDFKVYILISFSGFPLTQSGVSHVAPTTCWKETSQAKWVPQSKGFWLRAIAYLPIFASKYQVESSKCVIEFSLKSKNFMLGNAFMIPASTEVILFRLRPKSTKFTYTVSLSRHSPVTSAIPLDTRLSPWSCDASTLIDGIDVKKLELHTKSLKAKKPWK